MFVCFRCKKGTNIVAYSRHKKGSSGASGVWSLRAPIHQRTQKPNLHQYKGERYCTKCIRVVKVPYTKPQDVVVESVAAAPAAI